ncbi:tripartite tricarboxylate transporter substrate binding protein [Gallaecimonas pentaromativorans]|uniref:tripartite tricarboxylate transporter substrate binding protein n=1 Tax=Gallaecimonas pentaromativorans TaxID=584787 RepID=UPI003A902711
MKAFFLLAALLVFPGCLLAKTDIHFLIPGGPGGGWDTTARGTGEALVKAGLADNTSFQNLSGGGGGRAIAYLIEMGNKQGDMLMINSTPIVLRALSGQIPNSFRDLKPVVGLIADYGAFVVTKNSPYQSWDAVVAAYRKDPRLVKVAGGSARGSMDHLVAAQAFEAATGNGRALRYIPYDAGGRAKAGLLSGEVQLLSTGLSEALDLADSGEAKILAMTAPQPLADRPNIPTLKSLGCDMSFTNWRGLFASPDTPGAKVAEYAALFKKLMATPQWEAVRKRNGWLNLYEEPKTFLQSLERQESDMRQVMQDLGFIQ